MTYLRNVLIAIDQLFGTVFLRTQPDETISAWAYRTEQRRWITCINWLFGDPHHCALSYMAEYERTQLPEEYR